MTAHKVRVQNTAKGGRGGHFSNGEPFEVGAGATVTWDKVSANDLKMLRGKSAFRVWVHEDGAWAESESETAPVMKPWVAIASGASGERMRVVPLEEGEWFVGTVLASDAPDGPAGYAWSKIGAVDAVSPVATSDGEFDAAAYVSDKMPDVIAGLDGMPPERVEAVRLAEEATEKPRKGVLSAIADLQGKA